MFNPYASSADQNKQDTQMVLAFEELLLSPWLLSYFFFSVKDKLQVINPISGSEPHVTTSTVTVSHVCWHLQAPNDFTESEPSATRR